jgi:hypothetical protein
VARLLVQLKLRLLRNALRASTGATFATLFSMAVLVLLGAALTGSDPATVRMPVLVACAVVYGLGLAWIGVLTAARAAEQKLPELYQIAVRSKL